MAYSDWLQPSKTSGSGNDTVNVLAKSQNTGRVARQTTLTFRAANCEDVVRNVLQKGKAETSSIQDSAAVEQTGGVVTLTGVSNSSALTFELGTGTLPLTLPDTYTVNGLQIANGAAITGNPGATAEYAFSISFPVAENTSIDEMSRQVIVTDAAGAKHTCVITIAAGEAYLRVSPATIELPWDGAEGASFSVESNTNWQIV